VNPTTDTDVPPTAATETPADAGFHCADGCRQAGGPRPNHDRYVRAVADLENFRRRTVREKDELRQFAASRVLEDLLPVLDNLALGLAAARQPGADLKTLAGRSRVWCSTSFKSALTNHGLKEINPVGQPVRREPPRIHFRATERQRAGGQRRHRGPYGLFVERAFAAARFGRSSPAVPPRRPKANPSW